MCRIVTMDGLAPTWARGFRDEGSTGEGTVDCPVNFMDGGILNVVIFMEKVDSAY